MTFKKNNNLIFYTTGDCHGTTTRFQISKIANENFNNFAYIILGDAGFNFYLNENDIKLKNHINKLGCLFYLVRGNHEERPENLPNIKTAFDENVNGEVYYEPEYLNIRYFKDGGNYNIEGHSTLVLGGAYSVDKAYRIANRYPWFSGEQLTAQEMDSIYEDNKDKHFDLILSHTCPFSIMPVDLFLNSINQKTVDNSMEIWLDKIYNNIDFNIWLFGHFHADRIERPFIEMFYTDIATLSSTFERWKNFKEKEELDPMIDYSPFFYYT